MEYEEKSKLVRIKTYADSIEKSVTWVYKLAEKGEIRIKEIDGIKFVILKN